MSSNKKKLKLRKDHHTEGKKIKHYTEIERGGC